MNIETSIVRKVNVQFLVENEEDLIIRVDSKQVENILEGVSDVEENEVAILLATIKKNRLMEAKDKSKAYKKVDDELVTRAIIELLGCYQISNLISIFEEIKYYQIKDVLESDAPIRMLDEYL